ncbi:TetR/AcrR family transcriptional regulator [Nocardia inohanensis]|uniref:TetR/AcrR family transcriptional regulator n=1 Tax=Nocardia inohanensis TaxID=209246 RepID=UPI00082ABDAB|nr:TetR/AcrR family transcriptional regulator [Nocardia inohanensis]
MNDSARGDEDERIDPRRRRSRDRLLDAATQLLISGGVQAVTVEAVTTVSKVARTTLYRNFGNSAGLIAAAFERLLPQIEPPDPGDSVRRQLIDLLLRQAAVIDQVPVHVTTLAWLGLGSTGGPDTGRSTAPDSLRARVIERYRQPFDRVLDSPAARVELGDFDRTLGLAQLLGPIVFLRLVELRPTTRADCERIVDDFLATHSAPEGTA